MVGLWLPSWIRYSDRVPNSSFQTSFSIKVQSEQFSVNWISKLFRNPSFYLLQRLKPREYLPGLYTQYSTILRARQHVKQITEAKSEYSSADMFTRPIEPSLPSALLRFLIFVSVMEVHTVITKVKTCRCKKCGDIPHPMGVLHYCYGFYFLISYIVSCFLIKINIE